MGLRCASVFFFSSRRRHTRYIGDWSSDVCSSDLAQRAVVAVDDRSQDATGRILDEFAAAHPRLRVVHVDTLPKGWLGKPHALQKAYEASSGEWLLFTDADVRFKPDVLRRAISLVQMHNLDHLTLLGDVEMIGFWETVLITFFGLGFHIAA